MSGARVSTLLATAMLIPLASDAIVVRHDRDDSAFLELADTYRCTVTFMDADPAALSGMGTLIDRQWVLTAAHVAAGLSSTSIAEIAARAYPIAQIVLHPQWHRDADVRVDIAMVRLAQPVEGCAPVRLYTGVDEAGLVVTFVGRGAKGTGLSGVDGGGWDGQLRAATNRVVRADGPLLQFRFDAPGDAGVTALEGISGEADSGGPAYIELEGVLFTIGVSSHQDARPAGRKRGTYGVLEYYSRVSYFADWIREVLAPESASESAPSIPAN